MDENIVLVDSSIAAVPVNAGMLGCWDARILGCWDAGMLRCWDAGMLGC